MNDTRVVSFGREYEKLYYDQYSFRPSRQAGNKSVTDIKTSPSKSYLHHENNAFKYERASSVTNQEEIHTEVASNVEEDGPKFQVREIPEEIKARELLATLQEMAVVSVRSVPTRDILKEERQDLSQYATKIKYTEARQPSPMITEISQDKKCLRALEGVSIRRNTITGEGDIPGSSLLSSGNEHRVTNGSLLDAKVRNESFTFFS